MASGKFAFFEKGYRKIKDQCNNAHPLTWNSCDFLHKKTSQENKIGKLQKLRKDGTNKISEYDKKIYKFLESINDTIEAIDEEYSNKVQETKEKLQHLSKQTEKTKNK